MKKFISLIVISVLSFMFAINMYAQSGTTTAKSTAEIIAPLIITDISGLAGGTTLNFGRMTVSSTNSGSCILSPANVRSVTEGITAVMSSTTSTASFGVSGKAGSTYAITLPVASVLLTREGGAETLEVVNFKAIPASAGIEQNMGTLIGGNDTFTVGGTLNVSAAQAEGIYNGTFNVTVAYN